MERRIADRCSDFRVEDAVGSATYRNGGGPVIVEVEEILGTGEAAPELHGSAELTLEAEREPKGRLPYSEVWEKLRARDRVRLFQVRRRLLLNLGIPLYGTESRKTLHTVRSTNSLPRQQCVR